VNIDITGVIRLVNVDQFDYLAVFHIERASFSVTPRFSEVRGACVTTVNRFSGFSDGEKLLKQFGARNTCSARLKPGVNEKLPLDMDKTMEIFVRH
jgi:hypothetical protein